MKIKHICITAILTVVQTSSAWAVAPANFTVDFTNAGDISQKNFAVSVGQKVRLQVNPKETGTGCMSDIMIPGLSNKAQPLVKGKPVVMEFTPTRPGTYNISCSMGVVRGSINVK
jgi:uncharacterized protein